MTDEQHLAELKRRWEESGLPADEAAWLKARTAAGDLPAERLMLAAYLGHEAARTADGDALAAPDDLAEWVRGLERWGKEVLVRAAVAAARRVLPLWERKRAGDRRPHDAIAAAEAWLAEPTPERAAAAERAAEALGCGKPDSDEAPVSAAAQTYDANMGVQAAGDLAGEAAHFAADMGEVADLVEAIDMAEVVARVGPSGKVDQDVLRVAIRDAVAPWALGYGDAPG